jgi:hypothetical protein
MRPLARYLFLISHRAYALSTYFFDKSYISEFVLLYIFLFLENSRFVRFVLIYNRFLDGPRFKNYNSGNKSLFGVIKEHRFIHL